MALREILAIFGFKVDDKQIKEADKSVNGLLDTVRRAAPVVAAAFAGKILANFTSEAIKMGDEVGKSASQLGLTADQLQRLRFAADRAGIDSQAFTQSLMRLQRASADAANGNKTYGDEFKRLGVKVRDSKGELKDAETLLLELADGTKGIQNPTQRTATLMTIMGRSGAKMAPLFSKGAAGVKEMFERFKELGGGLSPDFTGKAEVAQDAITDYGVASLSLKSKLAESLLPAVTAVTNALAAGVSWVAKNRKAMLALKTSLVILGAAITFFAGKAIFAFAAIAAAQLKAVAISAIAAAQFAAAWLIALAPILIPLGIILAGIAAIVLLVEDFLVFMRGGKSVIGEFINELGLLGITGRDVMTALKMLTADWIDIWKSLPANLKLIWLSIVEFGNQIAKWFKDLFLGIVNTISSAVDAIIARLRSAAGAVGAVAGKVGRFLGITDAAPETGVRGAAQATTTRTERFAVSPQAGNVRNTTVNGGSNTVNINGATDAEAVAQRTKAILDEARANDYRVALRAVTQGG